MLRYITYIAVAMWLATQLSGCTPLVVTTAAAGGAYVGYKIRDEGYKINITKEIKGSKDKSNTQTRNR